MKIEIKRFDGKYPSFNVILAGDRGPFLEVKGCRIVQGQNGPFVSWPATKNDKTGKYWNHVYASEEFAAAVIKKVGAQPEHKPEPKPAPNQSSKFDDMDESIPF